MLLTNNGSKTQEEVGIEIAEAVIKALKGNLPATVVNEPLVALEVSLLHSLSTCLLMLHAVPTAFLSLSIFMVFCCNEVLVSLVFAVGREMGSHHFTSEGY